LWRKSRTSAKLSPASFKIVLNLIGTGTHLSLSRAANATGNLTAPETLPA